MDILCSDHKPVQHRDGKPPWCKTCGCQEYEWKPDQIVVDKSLASTDLVYVAKSVAAYYYNLRNFAGRVVSPDDVRVVWFVKALQNWKCLAIANSGPNGRYFEITYDGDRGFAYVDYYVKHDNMKVAVSFS
jgi:hypothetical protein